MNWRSIQPKKILQLNESIEGVAKTGIWKQSIKTGEVVAEGGWEFIFSQRSGDLLPVVKHARQLNF